MRVPTLLIGDLFLETALSVLSAGSRGSARAVSCAAAAGGGCRRNEDRLLTAELQHRQSSFTAF